MPVAGIDHPSRRFFVLGLMVFMSGVLSGQPDEQFGFPVQSDMFNWGHPILADIDGDGLVDIVAARSGPSGLHVVGGDGQELPGFPFAPIPGSGFAFPLVGNVDDDPEVEIVVGMADTISVISSTGALEPGWPVTDLEDIGGTLQAHIVLADLDGDGDQEIVLADNHTPLGPGVIYAFHGDGTSVEGWPVSVDYSPWDPDVAGASGIAAGDLDFDGDDEVVVTVGIISPSDPTAPSPILVYNGDGSFYPGWPVTPGSNRWGRPLIADLDGQGTAEVIAAGPGTLYVFTANGVPLGEYFRSVSVTPNLVAADLEGDGTLEVVTYRGGPVHIVDFDGEDRQFEVSPSPSALALADLDGDLSLEVIFYVNSGQPCLHVRRSTDFTSLPGWPLMLSDNGPSGEKRIGVGDLDGDGDLEIVAATFNQLHAWDLPNLTGAYLRNEWPTEAGSPGRQQSVHRPGTVRYRRGDVNVDGLLDVADGVALLGFAFEATPIACGAAADMNLDTVVDLADALHLLHYAFLGGPPATTSFPWCIYTQSGLPCAVRDCP